MEIIKVQTANREATEHCRSCLFAFNPAGVSHLVGIRRLDNVNIDGWHILLIEWDAPSTEPSGSSAGQAIVNELKRFGMVDRSVWVRSESTQENTEGPWPACTSSPRRSFGHSL